MTITKKRFTEFVKYINKKYLGFLFISIVKRKNKDWVKVKILVTKKPHIAFIFIPLNKTNEGKFLDLLEQIIIVDSFKFLELDFLENLKLLKKYLYKYSKQRRK